MFDNKSILITGGTGSFGKKFTETILSKYSQIKRLVIYSRDELKQYEMKQKWSEKDCPQIRYFIGDVRDRQRLKRACKEIDIVVHAAALKQVDAAEYNPDECIKTNISGAQNVIDCAIECKVNKIIALSTDKACSPSNLYGATKLVSDKLFVAANNITGTKDIKFSVVRYGNVMGSRGSVIPFFLEKAKSGILPVTDKRMTRFNISLEDSVEMVLFAICHSLGGEIFVPKIPSYRIMDVVKAISSDCKVNLIGIRPGEKIHEEMISESDGSSTIEFEKYYAILPSIEMNYSKKEYMEHHKAKPVKQGFVYCSDKNNEWETVKNLKKLIKKMLNK